MQQPRALYLPAVCSKWHIISRQPDAAFWAAGMFRWLRWHFSSLATKSSAHARHSCDAPRSVTSAGCSLQKESKSRPPCFWPCFAPGLCQTLFSNDNGNARGSLPVFPARRIRGLSRIFFCPARGWAPAKSRTEVVARNLRCRT